MDDIDDVKRPLKWEATNPRDEEGEIKSSEEHMANK